MVSGIVGRLLSPGGEAKLGVSHDPRDDDQHLPYEGDEMPPADGG